MTNTDFERDIEKAKKFVSHKNGKTSVYDKISSIISNVLDERPSCPVDQIESFLSGSARDPNEEDENILKQGHFAETQIKLFDKSNDEIMGGDGVTETDEEFEIPLPNCAQLNFYFEQAGVGLGNEEMYRIFLALKNLVYSYPLSSVRFWGKIFGLESNYLIAEAEYREGEGEEENLEQIKLLLNMLKGRVKTPHVCVKRCNRCGLRKNRANTVTSVGEEEEEVTRDHLSDENEEEEPVEEDTVPKSTWKPPLAIPKEDYRTGANKKVYFVCNQAGEEWVKLPHVTPAEISVARKITKLFTGRLDAKVESYPPFPGNESNLLRAQIARISASTQISPAGFYIFDDEEEEDENEVRESYMVNSEYEGMSLRELSDPSMINWVHHAQHILPQGRCTWFNPFEKPEDDFEEDEYDDEEDSDSINNVHPETGPPLLSTVANDTLIGGLQPWTTSISSRVLPEYAVAIARSNVWPGAVAFATPNLFDNIYIGWGKKYDKFCYNPPAPPPAFEEYVDDEETRELDDPTVEEEKALKEREEEAFRAAEEMENMGDEDDDED